MLELIVKYLELEKKGNFGREKDSRPIDIIEIRALLGLLYLTGLLWSNRLYTLDLWDTNGLGAEEFSTVISWKRFLFLLKCLRCRIRLQRLQLIVLLLLEIYLKCLCAIVKNIMPPGINVTLENLGFRGCCSFVQHIPFKPRIYRLKIYS